MLMIVRRTVSALRRIFAFPAKSTTSEPWAGGL